MNKKLEQGHRIKTRGDEEAVALLTTALKIFLY